MRGVSSLASSWRPRRIVPRPRGTDRSWRSPPTLGKGGWQLDQAWMGRMGRGSGDDEQMLRTMLSVGITEDLQISSSLPITLNSSIYMPRGRIDGDDVLEPGPRGDRGLALPAARGRSGSRLESTVFVGATAPLQQYRNDGMLAAPSIHVSAASGYASRTHYLWVGGGFQHFGEREGDQMGDSVFYSAVYGYRPPFLRSGLSEARPAFLVEAVGEHTERGLHHGFQMVPSGGDSILVGPTALLLYKQYRLEAGLLFPVYQQTNFQPEEKLRFGVNFMRLFLAEIAPAPKLREGEAPPALIKMLQETDLTMSPMRAGSAFPNARGAPHFSKRLGPRHPSAAARSRAATPRRAQAAALLAILLLLLPAQVHAEYTRIELKIFGMDCAICAHGVRVAIQKMDGVESVTLSLERAEADIRLRQENRVSLDQFRKIVKANGFEPRQATVTAVGTAREVGGKLAFEVSGVPTPLVVDPDRSARVRLQAAEERVGLQERLPCSRSSGSSKRRATASNRLQSRASTGVHRRPAAIDPGTSAPGSTEQHEEDPRDDHHEEDAYPHPRFEDPLRRPDTRRWPSPETPAVPDAATCYGPHAPSPIHRRPESPTALGTLKSKGGSSSAVASEIGPDRRSATRSGPSPG